MNVTELARKLKLNTNELLEILPEFGFDVGKRAIKVDDKIARKILHLGQEINEKIIVKKQERLEELKKLQSVVPEVKILREIQIPAIITVRDLAKVIDQPVNSVLKELMKSGVMVSLNEKIDFETAAILADEFGLKITLLEAEDGAVESGSRIKQIIEGEKEGTLKSRAPVVVVMGHVDHGKTRLLDSIRKTNVMEGEAGGITQHIGAYQVKRKNKIITFIDTPGHEAFTAMRSRGAKIADIAILVIAANDSIKPQTVEAIKIIQQAKLPMIVAINKIDLPEANIEKVKKDLSSMNLIPEDWGGQTITVPISAKQNLGIDDLLETIILISEMEKDKIVANPKSEAVGTIIESHIDKGEGPVATVLIQNGTLNQGDNLCINDDFFGKARSLKDYNSQDIKEAGPSVPVKIIGLKYSPKVGDLVEVTCKIERKHKKTKAFDIQREDTVMSRIFAKEDEAEDGTVKKINLIIKADVLGSLEAIIESLEKIETQEVKVKIITKGLGNITDKDVDLALSSQGIIIGFNAKATPATENLARENNVPIQYFDIIYKLLDFVKEKMSALLSPDIIRNDLGNVEVLAVFKTEGKNMIIGGKVLSGKVVKGAKVDVYRKKELITKGELVDLQAGKQNVTEVMAGQDCGMNFSGKPLILAKDVLHIYQEEKIIKKL